MTLRRLRPLTLLIGLLLAACTFQFNTTVDPSGAGEWRSEIGFTQGDKELLTSMDTSPEKFCADAQDNGDIPDSSPVTLEERGDETWCVVSVPFKDLAELRTTYEPMEGLTINELELTATSFTYDVDIAFTGDQGSAVGADQALFKWQVTAPGTITEHNADEQDGNTLTWNLDIGESVNARVVTTISPVDVFTSGAGGLPGWLIPTVLGLCCCLLLLVVIVVVVIVVLRRRQADNAAPPAAL